MSYKTRADPLFTPIHLKRVQQLLLCQLCIRQNKDGSAYEIAVMKGTVCQACALFVCRGELLSVFDDSVCFASQAILPGTIVKSCRYPLTFHQAGNALSTIASLLCIRSLPHCSMLSLQKQRQSRGSRLRKKRWTSVM